VKAVGGKTPAVTQSPSKHSQDKVQLQIALVEPSSRNDQSWLKRHCLERDEYCYVVTKHLDFEWSMDHRNEYHSNIPLELTDCAHILPFSLGNFENASPQDVENITIIWEALFRYFPALKGLIHSGTINSLENAFTLSKGLHSYFGMFLLTFEQTVI
jgi:HNH endonuclease